MGLLIEKLGENNLKNFIRFVDENNEGNYIRGMEFANKIGNRLIPVYGFWINKGGTYGTQAVIVTPHDLVNGNNVDENRVGITGTLMDIADDIKLYNEFVDYCNDCRMYIKAEILTSRKNGKEYAKFTLVPIEKGSPLPELAVNKWKEVEVVEIKEADEDLPF